MLFKNVEIFNAEEIFENEDGSVSWKRVPNNVYEALEGPAAKKLACCATGVEIRFKMNCDKIILKMAVSEGQGCFHVYRGSVQGGWIDHEVHKNVTTEIEEFVIEASEHPEWLQAISKGKGSEWNSDVIRVIFDRGYFKLYDIIGDIEPPTKEDCPSKTLMCYGSSITHGSNSMDVSHSWASVLAHNINYDLKNKGMAGSCYMEPSFAEYIAEDGAKGNWDALTLELGINVLNWEEAKIRQRVTGILTTVAGTNPDKPIFVISPFYHCGETFDKNDRTHIWRSLISEIIKELDYNNITYINGFDLLGEIENMSADFIHPNIYGMAQIAEHLTPIVKEHI